MYNFHYQKPEQGHFSKNHSELTLFQPLKLAYEFLHKKNDLDQRRVHSFQAMCFSSIFIHWIYFSRILQPISRNPPRIFQHFTCVLDCDLGKENEGVNCQSVFLF